MVEINENILKHKLGNVSSTFVCIQDIQINLYVKKFVIKYFDNFFYIFSHALWGTILSQLWVH